MIVKLLTENHLEFLSLKGGCRGSSESTHVKMPHCWKSHALGHMSFPSNFSFYKWCAHCISFKQNSGERLRATWHSCISKKVRYRIILVQCCNPSIVI